jgi:hypothetical protein
MHGLLVRLSVEGDPAQYQDMYTNYANALNERDGFVMKTWIASESMVGGFYIFENQESAQSYIDEMLMPTAEKYDVFAVQDVQHFPILATFSEMNHTPMKTAAVHTEATVVG